MEVHTHSHTARKKWTHYFWEFLMLFLAVFCGFLAENQREHYIEHERARQYASTMLEDLKADSEALSSGISGNQLIANKIDTLLFLYDSENTQSKTTGKFYYFGRHGIQFWHYVNKQVTLEQMKHSGTIRYFQNSFLENKFVALDKAISFIQYWEDREAAFRVHSLKYATSLFNYTVLKRIPSVIPTPEAAQRSGSTNKESGPSRDNFLQTNPTLLDVKLVNEYLNFCNLRLATLKAKIEVYKAALTEIEGLTRILKKEFHLN